MSAWPRRKSATTATNTTITTTTETVAETLPGVVVDGPGRTVHLHGWAQVTAGTAATTITPRIYRGADATGTLIGEGNPITVTAGQTVNVVIDVDDTPDEIPDLGYAFTVQQADATGNGNVLQASLDAGWS